MELFGGLTDIGTTPDGELMIKNGDLQKVTGIDWFIGEVNKILRSANDWSFAPNAGVALDRFYGSMNTREIGNQISSLITAKIVRQRINFPADVVVTVVPLDRDSIKIYINLNYDFQVIEVSQLVYDLQKGTFMEASVTQPVINTTIPNKFPYARRFQ